MAKTPPKKRLAHIAELQWEIDAWLQHCIDWRDSGVLGSDDAPKLGAQIKALDSASQRLFEAFGQPDIDHKLKADNA